MCLKSYLLKANVQIINLIKENDSFLDVITSLEVRSLCTLKRRLLTGINVRCSNNEMTLLSTMESEMPDVHILGTFEY